MQKRSHRKSQLASSSNHNFHPIIIFDSTRCELAFAMSGKEALHLLMQTVVWHDSSILSTNGFVSTGPVIIYGRGWGRRETILTPFFFLTQLMSIPKFIYPTL